MEFYWATSEDERDRFVQRGWKVVVIFDRSRIGCQNYYLMERNSSEPIFLWPAKDYLRELDWDGEKRYIA